MLKLFCIMTALGFAAVPVAGAERGEGTLLWSANSQLTPQGQELARILGAVEEEGLRPADYEASRIAADAARLTSGGASPADWQAFDDLLTRAGMRLILHLHRGRIDPRAAGFNLDTHRAAFDATGVLHALAGATDVQAALTALDPPFYHYALLKRALSRYRMLSRDPTLTELPKPSGTLHSGDAYAGAAPLRKLLFALGDLAPPYTDSPAFDPQSVEAVRHFQARHGLLADGDIGPKTLAALTTPLSARVRQIELTLERWRWLPAFATPPIIVNIPQFKLFAFRTLRDRVADIMQMDVIVGQTYARTRTPIFVGELTYVVFRPYWDVPRGILVREMLPQIRRHPDYMQLHNLEIVPLSGGVRAGSRATPESIADLAAGRTRLRQRPGDDNALGLIKFIFPNEHNVYMHSTPAHQLFLESRRAFSHGCIRVSDPVGLAAFVLRNAADPWDGARIEAAMLGPNDAMRVNLDKPIRVMILYGTVVATEGGPIQFFEDIYGHDLRLAALLQNATGTRHDEASMGYDSTPPSP